jgi:hypothetical protein
MGRLADRLIVRLALFALIATVLVWALLPSAGALNEFRDAQVLALHEHAAVDAVRRFGQLPLWNPWYCGGLYGLGEPQSRFAAPPFALSLIFGVERAELLVVFLFTVLGMEGTYRWVRLRVSDGAAALRVAPIFALSGHFAVAYFQGWTSFFGFDLLPFVLYGITLAARGRTGGIAVSALAFFVMIGFGGTFAAPIVAVAAAIEGLRALSEQPRPRRLHALAMLGALASFMLAVSAVRLLPLAETLSAMPRIMAGTPGHTPKALLGFLTKSLEVKDGAVADPGTFYVGAAFVALVALGGSDRRSLRPLAAIVVLLWFSAGYARKPALFALLRELPVFSALRYPERFLWVAILYAAEPAANALARLPRIGEGGRWRLVTNVVLTAAVIGTIGAEIHTFVSVGGARDLGALVREPTDDFRQARGNRWLAAHYAGLGVGSLSCWETHPVAMSPRLRGDLPAEEYVADPQVGRARRVSWSPNEIVVHVWMASAGRLFVNQNWHPGWRSSVGEVVSDDGLLAIELPPGESDVRLTFRPRSALAGAGVTLVALASLVALGLRARRGRAPFRRRTHGVTAALVLAPWAALGLFLLTWKEPRFPPAPLRNANGSPALVVAPAPDATKLGARYELPIALDAARLMGPDRLSNVTIDLYLRRTASLPRTTGMFVHVVRSSVQDPVPERGDDAPQTFFNADHQVVGGSFYLSDAPVGYVVHDAFAVHVGKAARGQYEVWVGFGHVTGRRGRSRVVEPGPAPVNEDRVRVGSFTVR